MKENKLISVIIPVYNTESYLSLCIQSVLDQTYTNFELFLIDDGSTDASGEICDQYAQKDSRIKVVHNTNQGVSHSRNLGLVLASGEYIAFCDADDQYKPNYLAELYDSAIQTNSDIIICNYSVYNLLGEKVICNRKSGLIEKGEVYQRIFIDNTIGGFVWNKLFKKDLLDNLSFDENMQICEDTYFLCKALKKAKKLYFVGTSLYLYRLHQTNTMNNILNMFDEYGNLKYATAYEKLIKEKIVEEPYIQYIRVNECVMAIGVKCDYLNSQVNIDRKIIHKLNKIIIAYYRLIITNKFYTTTQKLIYISNSIFNIRKYKKVVKSKKIYLKEFAKSCFAFYRRIQYFLYYPPKTDKSCMGKEVARQVLINCCAVPSGTVEANNTVTNKIDLSIIVPAYNVEQYIEQCVISLLDQKTKYQYEILIVDDGSTDHTADILKKFADKKNVHVIHQKNRGLSGARNRALEKFNGRYLMFVDSDDYILPGTIEKFLDVAYEKKADIVEGAAFSFYNDGRISRFFKHHYPNTMVDPMQEMTGYPWGKVYKSEIFKNVKFPEHYLFEDTIISMLIYPVCKNCWVMNDYVYAYRINMKGITQTVKYNPRSIESQWITEYLLAEQSARGLISEKTYNQFLDQVGMNYSRAQSLGENVKEAIFTKSRELYYIYFENHNFATNGYKKRKLQECFKNNDWKSAQHLLNYWFYLG